MSSLRDILSVFPFAFKNINRWRFRFLTLGVLVLITTNLSILYQSMLFSKQQTGSQQAVELNVPYELLVKLPEGVAPKALPDLPEPLNAYDYGKGRADVYTMYSKPLPFSHAENIIIQKCYSPFNTWDIWGMEETTKFFTWHTQTKPESNQIDSGTIILPSNYAELYGYKLGDSIPLSFLVSGRSDITANFVVDGFLNGDFDLSKPLVLKKDLYGITGNQRENAQLLACSEIRIHTTGLVRNMSRPYPGAEFIYPTMPADKAAQAIADIQAPAAWVIRLIYAFLGLGIMTIALITFLERRKELAILKSIGLRFKQIVMLYCAEYGFVCISGLLIGNIMLRLIIPLFKWSSELTMVQLYSLSLKNALITLVIFFVTLLYPILLSRAASVNQLVFARQIPLFTAKIGHLLRPKAELLYREREENVRILQADSVDQKLVGAFLRHPKEHVKQGEVVVIQESWFGFRYREWNAPCDGVFVEYDEYTGIMVFKPDFEGAARYPYPEHILATYDRRQTAFQKGGSDF